LAPLAEADAGRELEPLGNAEARAIVDQAIDRYIAARHERVARFVDRHFSLIGSLRLHRRAIGLDLVRAPANVLLMLPYLAMQLSGATLRRLGAREAARRLGGRALFLDTEVGRELNWRLHTELLELPCDDGRRRFDRDALAEAILADPRVAAALDHLATVARRYADDPARQARLRGMLGAYAGTRAAAADLVNNVLLATAGMAAFQKLTPGTLTLGPVIAQRSTIRRRSRAFRSGPAWAASGTACSRWRRLSPWSRAQPAASCCSRPAPPRSPGWSPIRCSAPAVCISAACTG
jgi:hypothetical protein